MRGLIPLAAIAFASSGAAAKAPAPPTPLFASDTPINITIQGPMADLVSNRSETPRPATLVADGITYPITLTPRGITRLKKDICDFPPLRVELTRPAPPGSLFQGQHRLKLFVHCKRDAGFQQKVLLEYSAYRLFNLMTPLSFRARLANINYVGADGRPYISRIGFFLEDEKDVARRNGMTAAKMGALVPLQQVEPAAGARLAVFEYMISNYDWSMRAGPQGQPCCHNSRLFTDVPNGPLIPVPYDFDFSGLVEAPYAGPPPEIESIDNLRQRAYRGYCVHLPQARAVAAQLASRRAEFTGVFATTPGLDARNQARAASFIQGFFSDVDSGKIFRSCVN
jgi:hypothetical protein